MAGDCTGSQQIIGQGASFAREAHTAPGAGWIVNAGCVVGAQDNANSPFLPGDDLIYYKGSGSGSGINAFGGSNGVRDQSIRFIGTDDPMTPTQVANAEEGSNPVNVNPDGDDGEFHTIPILQGVVAVIVNVPDTCRPASFSNFRPALPFGGAGSTNSVVEEAFSGEGATWASLGYVLKSNTAAPCTVPIKRVVRRDNSGTTFAFKQFLNSTDKDNDTNWEANDQTGEDNTIWLGHGRDRDGTCDGIDAGTPVSNPYICTGTGSGNPFVADTVNTTDGSIGYSDLATARFKGFDFTGTSPLGDDTYWLKLYQPAANPVLRDPARDQANGWRSTATTAQKGANCNNNTKYNNIPSNTKSDWSPVIQAQSGPVYPICALSYMGAWEDMEDVYPTVPYAQLQAEQAAVRRYIEYILGTDPVGVGADEGQTILPQGDYAALPPTPLTRANAYLTTFEGFDKAPDRAPVR